MTASNDRRAALSGRRAFCRFVASSPLWAAPAVWPSSQLSAQFLSSELAADLPEGPAIEAAADALNVFDLEVAARLKLPPAHYGQIATGGGSGKTLLRNRSVFDDFGIEARRMVGVSRVDTSIQLFGARLDYPILVAPAGSHKMVDPKGEVATARGAAAHRATMILSTFTSTPIEDVVEARGEPIWYQLYPNTEWQVTQALVRRAERAGAPVIVCTVDGVGGTRRELFERLARLDERHCATCHGEDRNAYATAPMFDGLETEGIGQLGAAIDWSFIHRLRQLTDRKLVIKGILAAEDAALAVDAGIDGIIVSNHGGRVFDTGVSTIEVLPEIVQAIEGRIPVLVDSGFRRGTDVFKGLALGASAVCIGRPYLWGLAAFGERGVATALNLINMEFAATMRQAGALSTGEIDSTRIRRT